VGHKPERGSPGIKTIDPDRPPVPRPTREVITIDPRRPPAPDTGRTIDPKRPPDPPNTR